MKNPRKNSLSFYLSLVLILTNSFSFSQSYEVLIDTTTYRTLNDSVFIVGDRILVRDVGFTLSGGGKILDYSKPILKEVADFVKMNPDLIFEIALFTDTRGNKSSNKSLSEMRAKSVFEYLVHELGVNKNQLVPVGYGSSELIIAIEQITTQTDKVEFERLHSINRRMELRVIGLWDACSDMSYY